MKAYKLVGYHPYWINNDKVVNFYQIEELLNQVNLVNPWVEIPSNNFNWTNINYLTFIDDVNSAVEYIKIEHNGNNFYYKKIKNEEIGTIDKDNNLLVTYHFELDEWNTYIYELLNLLLTNHCLVHFKRCFLDRLLRLGDKYILNFTLQKYLKDIIPLANLTNIREYVNGTNARSMYELNNPQIEWENIPTDFLIKKWSNNTQQIPLNVKEWFTSDENVEGDNHRFCYIVAKSSSMRKIDNNQKNLSTNTSQKIMIIPLPVTHKAEILHALNDINITLEHDAAIIVGSSNTISSKLVELPYALLFDWYLKNQDKCQILYGVNRIDDTHSINIPFFLIDFNQPLLFKIFDYLLTNSNQGIGKRIRDMVNNLSKLIPTSEPLLLNSAYYYELYNNGLTQYSVSFDNLNLEFTQNENADTNLVLSAYFNFFSNIDMSFYFGENTNIYQTDLDNTNTRTIDISIPFGLSQGASATLLEQGLNTGYTGLLNRQNEKGQAIGDATFNCAIIAADALGYELNPVNWLNPGGMVSKAAVSTLQIAKTIMDTTMEQQRADNSFYASIKNSTQAPNNINTSPFSKANIPLQNVNGNYLMMMYAIVPNQQCLDRIFSDYLHNGYIYDADDDINKFVNRKYMNVLAISPSDKIEDILNIWEKDYNNNIFKNKYWFTRALSFLGTLHNFYMTPYMVNVTNYKASNYLHNIEIESYNIPAMKQNIKSIITKSPNELPANIQQTWNILKDYNPLLTDEIINECDMIFDSDYKSVIITAKSTSQTYEGQVIFYPYLYNLYVMIDGNGYYVYDFNNFAKSSGDFTVRTNVGDKTFQRTSIFDEIEFIENPSIDKINDYFFTGCNNIYISQLIIPNGIKTIGSEFLANCINFNNSISIGNDVTKIGNTFLTGCTNFNSTLNLGNNIKSIGSEFLANCTSFNQPIVFPNSLEKLAYFTGKILSGCTSFNSTISFGNNLQVIGGEFLSNCTNFNQQLILPSSLQYIRRSFLNGCTNFNQNLSLPDTLHFIGDDFMTNTNNMVSTVNLNNLDTNILEASNKYFLSRSATAPSYTQGIKIKGTNAVNFKNRLPDVDGQTFYRKLIIVENE